MRSILIFHYLFQIISLCNGIAISITFNSSSSEFNMVLGLMKHTFLKKCNMNIF